MLRTHHCQLREIKRLRNPGWRLHKGWRPHKGWRFHKGWRLGMRSLCIDIRLQGEDWQSRIASSQAFKHSLHSGYSRFVSEGLSDLQSAFATQWHCSECIFNWLKTAKHRCTEEKHLAFDLFQWFPSVFEVVLFDSKLGGTKDFWLDDSFAFLRKEGDFYSQNFLSANFLRRKSRKGQEKLGRNMLRENFLSHSLKRTRFEPWWHLRATDAALALAQLRLK